MAIGSALYVGSVVHSRLRPGPHRLRYRMFSLLLDVDELPSLSRSLRFFSVGGFGLFSFSPKDHLSGTGEDMRRELESIMRGAGMEPDGGPIRLLTMPRILGYSFNPLSIFFCHGADGALRAILYEVNNTFGQRHSYFFPVAETGNKAMRHACEKAFYVSPFMPMGMTYTFRIEPPAEKYTLSIVVSDSDGAVLTAGQSMSRRALTDREMLRVFFTHPLMTLKVIAGIHYEALLIWLKGVGLQARPSPPAEPVTFVAQKQTEKESAPCRI
jgi:hypothetical protein